MFVDTNETKRHVAASEIYPGTTWYFGMVSKIRVNWVCATIATNFWQASLLGNRTIPVFNLATVGQKCRRVIHQGHPNTFYCFVVFGAAHQARIPSQFHMKVLDREYWIELINHCFNFTRKYEKPPSTSANCHWSLCSMGWANSEVHTLHCFQGVVSKSILYIRSCACWPF